MPEGSKYCQNCGAEMMQPIPEPAPRPETGEDENEETMTAEAQAAEQVMGAAQTVQEPIPQPGMQATADGPQPAPVMTKGISKPVLFGIIGGGVFLVAAAITLLIVFIFMKKTTDINLQDYTKVTFEGVDGFGTATCEIDSEKLGDDVAAEMGIDIEELKGKDYSELIGRGDDVLRLVYAIGSVSADLDKTQNLSNGDTVTVTYRFDEEKASEAGIVFKGDPLTKGVEGLEDVTEINPFDSLTVSFEGTSPNAYVSLQAVSQEEAMAAVYFEADKSDGLKLGDTITVSVKNYDEARFIEIYGTRFKTTEKTYTVENVDSYWITTDELPEDALNIMKESTEGYISEFFDDESRSDVVKASEPKYYGYYVLANRETGVWSGYNKVYMVFSATVSSKEKKKQFKPKTVYFPIEFSDIKQKADGSFEISTDYKYLLGATNLRYGYYSTVPGYTSKSEMREELVGANENNYDAKGYDGLAE